MADEDLPSGPEALSPRSAPVVRAGCLALLLLGVVSGLLSMPSLASADSVRCSIAEQMVEDANDDKKDWNDVDIGEGDVEDLSCPQAIAAAERIPTKENGDDFETVPSDGAVRFRGVTALIVGLGQAVSGLATLRTGRREVRNAALGFSAMGLIFAVLGLISLVILTFAVYAIGFSSAAQAIWPRARRARSGLFGQPRPDDPEDRPGDETPPGDSKDEPAG